MDPKKPSAVAAYLAQIPEALQNRATVEIAAKTMFCPQCRTEYEPGISQCVDCNVALVPVLEKQEADPDMKLVSVFETSDPGLVAIVESVLNDAGIDFMMKNQIMQDLLAGGRLAGFNQVIGPVQFLVRPEDEARAREALTPVHEDAASRDDDGDEGDDR
ncbi:MAG TPA: DUF2007 domain-containing protein [Thermoanaerobaculia bacterium]|nr:DUF2007 domain-containing protein [Thermoanaerobaculia bacterium]